MKMITHKSRLLLASLAIVLLLAVGCIVSGTFIIVEDFGFDTASGVHFEAVDITDDPDWQEHKDDIESIRAVGFEMTIENTSGNDITFSGYMDAYGDPVLTSLSQLETDATQILNDLTIPANTEVVMTYSQSIGLIMNVDYIKAQTITGQFHVYGYSSGGSASMTVSNGKVIVTLIFSG
jgi:hypothetical protein